MIYNISQVSLWFFDIFQIFFVMASLAIIQILTRKNFLAHPIIWNCAFTFFPSNWNTFPSKLNVSKRPTTQHVYCCSIQYFQDYIFYASFYLLSFLLKKVLRIQFALSVSFRVSYKCIKPSIFLQVGHKLQDVNFAEWYSSFFSNCPLFQSDKLPICQPRAGGLQF